MTHPLKKWLRQKDLSGSEFCRLLDIDRSTLTRYFNGSRVPTKSLAVKIHEFTNGEVGLIDLLFPTLQKGTK